ncbi:protein Shroom [Nasonia vitripennis]|uniref:ASD2 domain-containing protein n=1 Tax=Nasonia vitripennis TaxID=7425 RepID=A0A7M7HBB1_NASVI|nr:protein Shroom [Nasonia vitripennis]
MTTELQPSPPGYRGQQDACPVAAPPKLYHRSSSGHLNYTATAAVANNDYRRRTSPPSENEDVVVAGTTQGNIIEAAYEESNNHQANFPKKNAPGYKNDSGYSESLGFESFSLALSERDAASPPPTPPVRDASSLKSVCYGPGHEKYPSWPTAPECRYSSGSADNDHDDGSAQAVAGGSHRSKSWTDHTNYPKEKPAQYTRPHNKRPNSTFTQQLKTVMERCEKIPAETFESRSSRGGSSESDQQRLWPSVDREGKSLGDAEYVVPSPPERESLQAKTLSPADLEAYVRSYQDPQVSQVELYGENDLTQTGLEEYTTVQHSQQASYAQSEGYHSYVSSVDSTTTTPFLDRLRRDSEAVSARPMTSWEDGSSSREGRDSVVTTSSGSASSSETLKWHGSMSDVSVSSGMPTSRSSGLNQDRWHHGSMSDLSSINGACPPIMQKSGVDLDQHDKWQDSMLNDVNDHHNNNNNHHSSSKRLSRDNWQVSMNDRNKEIGQLSPTEEKNQWEHSMSKSFHVVTDRMIQEQSVADWEHSIHSSMSDVSQTNGSSGGSQGSKQLIAHSARVQTPQRHHSESVLYLDRERSQRKLYPVSTTKLDEMHSVSRLPPSSPQQVQPSVADRIIELEKHQQQMRYTYLDPDKRHRVSDPTLKAIQKKALLSFYERHQHQASWRSEPQLLENKNQSQPQQRHSPPPQPPPRPRPVSSRRASSASDYASGTWREKNAANKATPHQPTSNGTTSSGSNSGSSSSSIGSELPRPNHQHSNSCGSLSTDLLGPVIVGPAISIDDWVPERPPKKPHLRTAYSDRLPSPDLPPPSPPTVTDIEVLNFDDPLPPPPPELSQVCTAEPRLPSTEQRHENSYFEETPCDRINERNSSSRRSTRTKKTSPELSPTSSPPKSKSNSPNQEQQQSFHFECKPASIGPKPSHVENGFANSNNRLLASGRSSLRYSSAQKHMMNEKIAAVRRSADGHPALGLPDLVAQKYSDSGNQRPAPQVPVASNNSCCDAQVEPKINRQDSLKLDDLSKHSQAQQPWLDCSTRQKPRAQAPKTSSPTSPTSHGPKSPRGLSGNKYQQQPRNYFALPAKYPDAPKSSSPPTPQERYEPQAAPRMQRDSPPPPPLAPRTPGKKISPPPRPAPPMHSIHQGSQSKASYLAYRRERGAPDSEGSYKRTMSPNARLDDPVLLLKVTPHHQQSLINNNNNNNDDVVVSPTNNNQNHNNINNNQYQRHPRHELAKSQSSDALQQHQNHHRLEDHFSRKSLHNVNSAESNETNNKTSRDSGQAEENGCLRRSEKRERLSPQSVEVLNDRNRQLERERRKLAASCEPQSRLVEDFYRESAVTTIEMTSQNVEMLNRRNVAEKQRAQTAEARSPLTGSPKFVESPSRTTPPTVTTGTTTTLFDSLTDRKVSSPTQTDQSWDRKSRSSTSSSSTPSSPTRTSPTEKSSSSSSKRASPCVSPQSGVIEGLTLVQRTEVVLRVNAPTNDVASQTEEPATLLGVTPAAEKEVERHRPEEETESLAKPRKKLQEEIECEELSRDLANQLGPDDKLLPILVPIPEHKKSTDYVVDLFRVEAALHPRPRPRLTINEESTSIDAADNESEEDKKIDSIPSTPVTPSAPDSSSSSSSSPLSASSVYFTTSESKARFLTRYSQDVVAEQVTTTPATPSIKPTTPDSLDLRQKKEELMIRLDKKLVVLRAEQEAVREEGEVNEALGSRVQARIAALAKPAEASKYRLHVEEVGKITSLLLGLSGRLARAENALYGMPADHPERKILESKRDKLMDQLEEAKILKGNIDRRSVNVSAILSKYLSDEEFADYQHFINMKAKLIVDGREIQDKVKLGEEQLAALKEAIDL